ncbi:S9 family peptidase [Skermania piniformis]|uniref:Prolyl oligopeptidase family serine peptidase n=1 Tax=Skermania pinensis TaxID=39122 RepID=A0ABX8S815_9ACTN|nr:prolyl oligopeptidase family serine peptidase [Skermania piniformis]QXQ13957.1 prolyl oligopeptidase family serine peptidase [Skermania piniformis]
MTSETSYPRESARTQRYTLGLPRDVVVSPDGRRILFLRSRSGTDPVTCLWVVDAATGTETLVADPAALLAGDDHDLPAAERARRERAREAAGGITGFATDAPAGLAAFALAGRLFVADLTAGTTRELAVAGPVFDPRPDPTGRRIGYVSDHRFRIADLAGSWHEPAGTAGWHEPAGTADDTPEVGWGGAEFIAAEEMGRFRGFWWSPDGERLAVTRVDDSDVQRWHIADPARPEQAPITRPYPAAGTPNAAVTLHIVGVADGRTEVVWDRPAFEYLTDVAWSAAGLICTVQSRDQRQLQVLDVDPTTGATRPRWTDTDDDWVELVPGVPRLRPDGALVTCADRDGARRLLLDGTPVTPADLQVRAVTTVDGPGIVFTANRLDDATDIQVWRYHDGDLTALTTAPGVHRAAAAGGTVVIGTATLAEPGTRWATRDGVELTSHAAAPTRRATPTLHFFGKRRLATAVLLPANHDGSPLPVLLDPYGGPHGPRVLRSHNAHLASQWFADQGFAVLVIDGRGTPGRGTAWERAVHHDLATAVLDDQVDGLHAAADELGVLDLSRVAIRGWSFGGYLAALAVLRRPDVFHAAVAGAPVTEWRLYDTHYTERYLGDPAAQPEVYDAGSLLPLAPDLRRPLLLIHGLADDNVVAAHTLQLSSALLAAGRPHEVLPLVGVSHMTPQEVVAENLLLHQLDFLRRSLGPERVGAV